MTERMGGWGKKKDKGKENFEPRSNYTFCTTVMLNLRFSERRQIVEKDLASDLATAIPLVGGQA